MTSKTDIPQEIQDFLSSIYKPYIEELKSELGSYSANWLLNPEMSKRVNAQYLKSVKII